MTAAGKYTGKSWDTVAVPDFYSDPQCIVEWGSQKRTSNDHGLIGHKPMTNALKKEHVNIVVDPRKPASAGAATSGCRSAPAPTRRWRSAGCG